MLNRLTLVALVAAAGMAVPALAQEKGKDQPKQPKVQTPAKEQPKKGDKPKQDITLKVGDKAPALSVEDWVKGDKVEKLEDGKVYVVEFWATWCGPCKESIPHLSKLQKEFKGKNVTVIGVAASERGEADAKLPTLKKFVKDKGDEMAYTIAYDADRSMSKAWMQPAGQDGIPCAFVVGKDGKIAWIGHPAHGLDDAVKKALSADNKAEGPALQPSFALVSFQQEGTKAQDSKKQEKAEKQPAAKEAPKLVMGDKAPELTVAEFVKGTPVTGFEKGRTYVVEFWATWCGPCKESIPHLTELQKANKDVKFIGVAVWEREPDQSKVKGFVKEMGDEMDYTVAMDKVPTPPADLAANKAKSWTFENGAMAKNWMKAAGRNGIPTAFIVNGEGKVAWIGHPQEIEKPLKAVVDGKWDIAAESAKAKDEAAKVKDASKTRRLQQEFAAAMQGGDDDEIIKAADALTAADPTMAARVAGSKFKALGHKDNAKAYAFAKEAMDGPAWENAQAMNEIAWTIVDPDDHTFTKKDLDLALKAASRGDELSKHKNPAILDTLAKVYHDKGDLAKAIEIQEKAVKALDDVPEAQRESMEQELKDRLQQFKDEAKKKGA